MALTIARKGGEITATVPGLQGSMGGGGNPGERGERERNAGPALAEPLFQAAVDTVVGPIELPGSFVLARVNRIRFPEALPLSQVRDKIVDLVRREKGKDLAVVKAYEAQPKAASAKSVKATAAAFEAERAGKKVVVVEDLS